MCGSSRADGQTEHRLTVARADYQRLTGLAVKPELLVEKTFEFLLAREAKYAILRQFDLNVVARYFPEYETELKRALASNLNEPPTAPERVYSHPAAANIRR